VTLDRSSHISSGTWKVSFSEPPERENTMI